MLQPWAPFLHVCNSWAENGIGTVIPLLPGPTSACELKRLSTRHKDASSADSVVAVPLEWSSLHLIKKFIVLNST